MLPQTDQKPTDDLTRGIALLHSLMIFLFVFLSGFANLATEIIGPRMVSAFFGSSTFIWAVMISITLTGLALGYVIGGRLTLAQAKKYLPVILVANALYLLVLSWAAWNIQAQLANYGAGVIILILLLLFFGPSTFFGTISPIAVSLLSEQKGAAQTLKISGMVYAFGTLGNFCGALSAAFILIPYVGLSVSLRLFSLGLVLFGLYFWLTRRFNAAVPNTSKAAAAPPKDARLSAASMPANVTLLLLFVFFSGFANLATEIIAPRMFASMFGPTTILWAIVISVTLVGLSVGYFVGGYIPLSRTRLALGVILLVNAFLLLAASWLVWELPVTTTGLTYLNVALIAGATFFLPSALFGMNTQIAVTLVSSIESGRQISNTVGTVFAVSTVGSVVGALAAAVFFIPVIGFSTSLVLFAMGLVIFDFYFLPGRLRILALPTFALCLLIPQPDWKWENQTGLTLLTQTEGYYQTIRIYSDNSSLVFHLGPTYESDMDLKTHLPLFGYATQMVDLAGDVAGKNILLIGGAGHSMARALEARGATITEVEIDPVVVQVSDKFFGALKGDVVVQDGRAFVQQSPSGIYDYVLIDAFNGPASVPAQLTTVEFFQAVRRALKPDGRMIMNFIGNTGEVHADSFRALGTTIAAAFTNAEYAGSGNIIFVASQASIADVRFNASPTNGHLLTDDLNPIEIYLEDARAGLYFMH